MRKYKKNNPNKYNATKLRHALNENTSGFDYEEKLELHNSSNRQNKMIFFLLNSCKFAEINIKVKIR